MSAINTLRGKFIKDYSVKYREKIENGLWLYVILKYVPIDTNKFNSIKFSSEIEINAIITDGKQQSWSNNVISYNEVTTYEDIKETDNFKDLSPILYTKNGYKVWQDLEEREYISENREKRKIRQTKWLIEIPKYELLKMCIKK